MGYILPAQFKWSDVCIIHPAPQHVLPLIFRCWRHVRDEASCQQRLQWQLTQLHCQLTHLHYYSSYLNSDETSFVPTHPRTIHVLFGQPSTVFQPSGIAKLVDLGGQGFAQSTGCLPVQHRHPFCMAMCTQLSIYIRFNSGFKNRTVKKFDIRSAFSDRNWMQSTIQIRSSKSNFTCINVQIKNVLKHDRNRV